MEFRLQDFGENKRKMDAMKNAFKEGRGCDKKSSRNELICIPNRKERTMLLLLQIGWLRVPGRMQLAPLTNVWPISNAVARSRMPFQTYQVPQPDFWNLELSTT